jgi:hypothetical protein
MTGDILLFLSGVVVGIIGSGLTIWLLVWWDDRRYKDED